MSPGHPYTENDERTTYGRRLPKDPPLVMGGQGRSDDDVEADGMGAVCWMVCAVLIAAMVVGIYVVTR